MNGPRVALLQRVVSLGRSNEWLGYYWETEVVSLGRSK